MVPEILLFQVENIFIFKSVLVFEVVLHWMLSLFEEKNEFVFPLQFKFVFEFNDSFLGRLQLEVVFISNVLYFGLVTQSEF